MLATRYPIFAVLVLAAALAGCGAPTPPTRGLTTQPGVAEALATVGRVVVTLRFDDRRQLDALARAGVDLFEDVDLANHTVGAALTAETTRVVEFNDLEALAEALGHEDVACVLAEPALTNIGIVLPEPGYHDELRRLTRETGTLLIIDETHTFCCGPGGYTRAHGLDPDLMTIGKPIAGGVPTGAYGMTDAMAARVLAQTIWEAADVGGVGGTLAGNALSLAAARATLSEVLTEEAFARMIAMGERFESGVQAVIDDNALAWTVTRLGCRAEYMLGAQRPRDGAEAAAAFDTELDALLHLYMLNRGILMTPFHMMALMCPTTSESDVDSHTAALGEVVAALTA